jgi:hypothetical protein
VRQNGRVILGKEAALLAFLQPCVLQKIRVDPGGMDTMYSRGLDGTPITGGEEASRVRCEASLSRVTSGKGIDMITEEPQLFEIDSSAWEFRQHLVKPVCRRRTWLGPRQTPGSR